MISRSSAQQVSRIQDSSGRHYVIDGQPEKYPSITQVLSCRNNGWVEEWRDNVGHDRADTISNKAAKSGTAVHMLAEHYLLGHDIRPLMRRAMPEVSSRFKNFIPFLEQLSEVELLEAGLVSTLLKVGGTVDCIAKYNNKRSAIDFKTSSKLKTIDQIQNYFAQATFYSYAAAEMFNIAPPQLVIAINVYNVKEPQVFIDSPKNHIHYLLETIKMYNAGESD